MRKVDDNKEEFSVAAAIVTGAAIGLILVLVIGAFVGCYPRPPVDPPTCAEDPTQEWRVDAKYRRRRNWYAAGWAVLIAGLLILFASGCPKPGPTPVTPPDASDGAPPATCFDACNTVSRLGCKGSNACKMICPRVLSQAYKDCVSRASSCEAVNLCDQGVGNE